MNDRKLKIGITQGDINGIGYEVIIKAFSDEMMLELCTPVLYGVPEAVNYYKTVAEVPDFKFNKVQSARDARPGHFNVVDISKSKNVDIQPGQPTEESARLAVASLDAAVEALKSKAIDAVVTAPINKEAMKLAEFPFPGHTEYFESHFAAEGQHALMVLCCEDLRVALVTMHEPLSQVPGMITKELILDKLQAFNQTLRRDFALSRPKIAVLSLNPHAGDGGVIGTEEDDIIRPAIKEASDNYRIMAFGPYAADGFFGNADYRKFDGVLAMYHDQGLIPLKTIAMDSGVNFTAGIDCVRTSPDHGTAYAIAGKGEASPESMRAAIYAAIDTLRHRNRHDSAIAHPLRRQRQERNYGRDKDVAELTQEIESANSNS